jgi:hypothetical protein
MPSPDKRTASPVIKPSFAAARAGLSLLSFHYEIGIVADLCRAQPGTQHREILPKKYHRMRLVGIDALMRGRQETLRLRPQFMRPQLLHRSKNYALPSEIVSGSAG